MTITGTIQDVTGIAQSVVVQFIPYAPTVSAPSSTCLAPISVATNSKGYFTTLLGSGFYYVKVRTYPIIEFFIDVPDGVTAADVFTLQATTPSVGPAFPANPPQPYCPPGGPQPFSPLPTEQPGEAMAAARMQSGFVDLPQGVSTYTITGLNLPFTPKSVFSSVQAPAGGGLHFNTTLVGTPTTDGFTIDLGGTTDNANYVLGWIASV